MIKFLLKKISYSTLKYTGLFTITPLLFTLSSSDFMHILITKHFLSISNIKKSGKLKTMRNFNSTKI